MKYRDRQGREYEQTTSQDSFLAAGYSSAMGRALMKFLGCPIFSKCARVILDSKFSVPFIFGFAEKNGIDMFDYEERMYRSFNDFFTRKIKPGRRFITKDKNLLVSPSDGKVTAYKITQSDTFIIKNAVYNTASLLRDSKLAKRYEGGYAVIIRLSVDDYHRYCYCADGVKSHNRKINGILHTVNPVVNNYLPVFKENSREYCMIRTEQFGDIIQMEVGALMVGRITNLHTEGGVKVTKGEEKGYFEFGNIPYGEYVVREIKAPTGYILSDESYPVSISEDGEVIEITAENKPITVKISKRDIYGNELKGAKMQIIDSEGNIVDEWTSDGTDHIVTELPAGDYTLKEIAAPDGYVIATDIKFTVDVYGNVTVENADAAAIAEDGTPIVIMVDEAKPSLPDTPHTVTTDNPHTGVSSDNGICIYLMIGSVMLLSLIFAIRKNNERRDV